MDGWIGRIGIETPRFLNPTNKPFMYPYPFPLPPFYPSNPCGGAVYGPDVYNQSYFSALNFPHNLPSIWDAHWGFLRDTQDRAIVVGEWGGFCRGKDGKWQRRLARYLRERGMADTFYWCLNPNVRLLV